VKVLNGTDLAILAGIITVILFVLHAVLRNSIERSIEDQKTESGIHDCWNCIDRTKDILDNPCCECNKGSKWQPDYGREIA
jgi:hypothetical protein